MNPNRSHQKGGNKPDTTEQQDKKQRNQLLQMSFVDEALGMVNMEEEDSEDVSPKKEEVEEMVNLSVVEGVAKDNITTAPVVLGSGALPVIFLDDDIQSNVEFSEAHEMESGTQKEVTNQTERGESQNASTPVVDALVPKMEKENKTCEMEYQQGTEMAQASDGTQNNFFSSIDIGERDGDGVSATNTSTNQTTSGINSNALASNSESLSFRCKAILYKLNEWPASYSGPKVPNNPIPTKEASALSIQRSLDNLVHASECINATCRLPLCLKMKRVIVHTKACKTKPKDKCNVCKQLVALSCYHAKNCHEQMCIVPFCREIKLKLRQQRSTNAASKNVHQ